MATAKKLFSRILIDLPVSVHKTLKLDAVSKGNNLKNDIEQMCIDRAARISAKQIELFNANKPKKNAKNTDKH